MSPVFRTLFTTQPLNSLEVRQTALQFGADYLRDGWQKLTPDEVEVTQITGGQSNLIYMATASSDLNVTPSCFLIRIHCQPAQQVFTDTVIFSILSERGVGPKLYGFFPGGRLEEFLPSTTLDVDRIKEQEISRQVGALFPKFHTIDMPIPKIPGAIRFMRDSLKGFIELGGNVHKMKNHSVHYPEENIPTEVNAKELEHEIDVLEKWAATVLNDTLVFCHNDLAPLNVLELNSTKEIVFIDFEYASYNWRSFDLCMFLCENAFDYRGGPPGIVIDQHYIENHPNLKVFSAAYLEALGSFRDEDVEKLMLEIKFFIPYVNLFWAIWSLKQHLEGHDNGIDLEVAASDRLSMYYHFKPQTEQIFEKFNV